MSATVSQVEKIWFILAKMKMKKAIIGYVITCYGLSKI